ncbi:DNAH [Mytilus coruscus]|uniref:DNAH n=1 Tax=Mytilus coruscus TaxID=42192 RepID=A0A6J8EP08_MYTCO|nr:DNAH [Mytilus coruscus]
MSVKDLGINDVRIEFQAEYAVKSLNIKPEKISKLFSLEETKQLFIDFFDKADNRILVIAQPTGALNALVEFPGKPKGKACFFVKKNKESIGKDSNLRNNLLYGDLSYSPLEQLSAFVDEVLFPLLSNERNHESWPKVVSEDVVRHVHTLKSDVYVITGQTKGKTLLPLPVGAEKIEQVDEQKIESDRLLIHSIESMVIDWTHQIRDVLKRDSAQPLLEGLNPTPFVEIEFWKTKATNLECIYDQLKEPKVRKMAELLEKIKSSYYPVFKDIFRDVIAGKGIKLFIPSSVFD